MDKEKLVELAKTVAESRSDLELVKGERVLAEKIVAESAEGQALQLCTEHLVKEQGTLAQAEDQLKIAVLEVYKETKERKPITGTEVKIFKWLEYDAAKALEWCRTNAKTLLTLNKKPFEKTAVNIGAPVKEKTEPRCSLAKDLSAYLEPATEPVAVTSEGGK